MQLTLKRLRQKKGLSLTTASKLFGIKAKTLEEIEEYKRVPEYEELVVILKMLGLYYDEIYAIIMNDIALHYNI